MIKKNEIIKIKYRNKKEQINKKKKQVNYKE